MKRRIFLARSAVIATVMMNRPSFSAEDWRASVGELRCGGLLSRRTDALSTLLRVPVRPVPLEAGALVEAFHAGQIEFGRFEPPLARMILARMGDRVTTPRPGTLILRSLPHPLRMDVAEALSQI